MSPAMTPTGSATAGAHPRPLDAPGRYDPVLMKPSKTGIDYLIPIFTDAIGNDDMEHLRQTLFAPANLTQPCSSTPT